MPVTGEQLEIEKISLSSIKCHAVVKLNGWLNEISLPVRFKGRMNEEFGTYEKVILLQQAAVERKLGLLDKWKYERLVSRIKNDIQPRSGEEEKFWNELLKKTGDVALDVVGSSSKSATYFEGLKQEIGRWAIATTARGGIDDVDGQTGLDEDELCRRRFSYNRGR